MHWCGMALYKPQFSFFLSLIFKCNTPLESLFQYEFNERTHTCFEMLAEQNTICGTHMHVDQRNWINHFLAILSVFAVKFQDKMFIISFFCNGYLGPTAEDADELF